MKITVPLILFGALAGVSSFVPALADFLLWLLIAGVALAALGGLLYVVGKEIQLSWECTRPTPTHGARPPVYHPSSPHARRAEKEAAGE